MSTKRERTEDDPCGADRARSLALGLPGAVEQDHHGFPSFRVQNRIFATLPNPHLLRVFVSEHSVRAVIDAHPDWCSPVMWGKKVSGVGFDLDAAVPEVVDDYLTEAWSDRAPKALLDELDQRLAIDHETKPWVLD